jgi:CubicO group peptidase (beta-lactamase class C family)
VRTIAWIHIAIAMLVLCAKLGAETRCAERELADQNANRSAVAFLQSSFERFNLPGAAAVLVQDGAPSFVSFGTDANGDEISPDTRFYIGSLSKAFTAAAVLQLVESGEVELDASAQTYVPEFRTRSSNDSLLTVRQLLNQTSGLRNDTYAEWRFPQPIDLKDAVARLRSAGMEPPGQRFSYHNPNYTLLARLVENVSGESFSDYLRDHIFVPLGMTSTKTIDRVDELRDGAPSGHVLAFGHYFPMSSPAFFVNGAGGVLTTPRDYLIWILTQLREGEGPNGFRILTAESVRASHTPGPNAGEYGFGWNRRGVRVSHSGGLPNHAAYLAMEDCNAIAVLAHVAPVAAPLRTIALGSLRTFANAPVKLPERGFPWFDYVLAAVSVLTLIWALWLACSASTWSMHKSSRPLSRVALTFLPQVAVIATILIVFPWLVSTVISWSWIWLWFYMPMLVVAFTTIVVASIVVLLTRAVALWRYRKGGRGLLSHPL